MERKPGEIFELNGNWYQCVKGDCYEEMIDCLRKGKMPEDDPYFFPRKQIVNGVYCKTPCKFRRKKTDLTMEQAMNTIKFLAWRLDKELTSHHESNGHEEKPKMRRRTKL